MALHCPYCGDELTVSTYGELECKRGGMYVSRLLEGRFRDIFERSLRPTREVPHDAKSGHWFCPGCGLQLKLAEDGLYRCPKCGQTIGEFVYALIEFHPHGINQAPASSNLLSPAFKRSRMATLLSKVSNKLRKKSS
jgi:tRNA(Ile2) C34 agmatinyltransferase TiaS